MRWRAIAIGTAAVAALWLVAPRDRAAIEPRGVGADSSGRAVTSDTTSQRRHDSTAGRATTPADANDGARLALLRDRLAQSSLRGAEADGEVRIDGNGQIVANESLRRLFDHFLSLTGEFAPGDIARLLRDQVERGHGAQIADQVQSLFSRYVAMRAELSTMALSTDLAKRFEQLRAVRRAWFGEDAETLFGDEEDHTAMLLERAAVMREATLDAAQRDARLAQLESARPAALRDAEQDATSAVLVEQQTRQFEQLRSDPFTREQERSLLWGQEAAQRLAALDQERAIWDRRVTDYLDARNRIAADASLSATARATAIIELRRRAFDANERRRIEALESIGALRAGG